MPDHNEVRPRLGTEGDTENKNAGGRSTLSVPTSADARRLARSDLFALAGRREYAVRVVSQRRDGILVTQIFADLKAAERKAARVRSHALDVRLELVRVMPVMPLDDESVAR